MTTARREWSTFAPPTYEAPKALGTVKVTMPSLGGWRCVHIGPDGEVVAVGWSRFREVAIGRADALVMALPAVLAKHPNGVPFDRSRAQ